MSDDLSRKLASDKELHKTLVAALVGRKRAGQDALRPLYDRWQRDEEQYVGFIEETVVDRRRQIAREAGESEYKTIHIPYNYAMLMAAHTYITSTMFARNPIWQFQGTDGEAQMNELAVEAFLDYQVNVGGHSPHHYVWTHDALRYGHGVLGQYWCERMMKTSKLVEKPRSFLSIPVPGTARPVRETIYTRSYAGMEVFNVKPSMFYWDPRYSAWLFQQGEFAGREYEMNELDLLVLDYDGKPRYFNVPEARRASRGHTRRNEDRQSSVMDRPSQNNMLMEGYDLETRNLQVDDIYIRLSPRDWKLGPDTQPEKWVFTLVEEEIIVKAQPLGLYHDKFPFSVCPAEVEGWDRAPRSILYMTEALNETLSWLVNTHFFNVRKALNDQFVVDPSKVIMNDLINGGPGRMMRLRPSAYGTDTRTVITQLPSVDITKTNVDDMNRIADMMQRILGINDTIMGTINTGRRTATEVRSSTTFGINRLKTMVEYMSAVAFAPHSMMMLQTSQQMMDYALKLRIIGDLPRTTPDKMFADVSPETIAGFFSFVPVDGTLPVDRLAQVNIWNGLFQSALKIPAIATGYDWGGVFSWVAKLAGMKSIDRFRVNVMPPGQVAPPPGTIPLDQAAAQAPNGYDNSGAPVGNQPAMVGPMQ